MRLAYSSATEEVASLPLAWVGPLDTVLPAIAKMMTADQLHLDEQ